MRKGFMAVSIALFSVLLMVSAGCESNGDFEGPLTEKKCRLIASQNQDLKRQLETCQTELENTKKQLEKCYSDKSRVQKETEQKFERNIESLTKALMDQNKQLREENMELKQRIKELE